LCQGEAADIQKEITVAVVEALKGTPIQMVANVHDATLFQGPKEVLQDPRVQHSIAWILQNPKVPLRVPLRLSMGYGEKHWAEADDNSQAFECDPNLVDTSFSFLK
jgi:DNA polymerase I-like protein with 3'-5' exonuclease and polymerase domains